jgi:RHS repeat-associated protein
VTDQNGKVHEHVEYYPYGEVWWEPKYDRDGAGVKGQQFLFTSKEFDEETGLYYFGARYYDPKKARWESTDPMLLDYIPSRNDGHHSERMLPGHGGVFAPPTLSTYGFSHFNPATYRDPTGKFVIKIPFTSVYFYAEFKKSGGGFLGVGFTTSGGLLKRHPKLAGLSPEMRDKAERVLARLEGQGWKAKVAEGLRTPAEQAKKVAEGVSRDPNGPHLNKGKGAEAMDVIDTRWWWNDASKEAKSFFKNYGEVAEGEGLEWGGAWKTFHDPAHSQIPHKKKKE